MPKRSHSKPFSPVPATQIGLMNWQGHARRMERPHRHNEIEINLVEGGSFTYLLGGNKAVVPPWRLALFWAGIPHQLIATPGATRCNWVTLPLVWFLQWKLPDSFTQKIMRGELIVEGDASRTESDLALFKQWAADKARPANEGAEHRSIFLLELEARLRRLTLSCEKKSRTQTKSSVHSETLPKVEQMVHYVAQHYMRPLRVAEIAGAVGLHPNYAMNLFRKSMGTSLVDYATQHRISHAQRLLLTSDAKILDVALESGFGSLSRFYAVFAEACGMSPKEYRASLRIE